MPRLKRFERILNRVLVPAWWCLEKIGLTRHAREAWCLEGRAGSVLPRVSKCASLLVAGDTFLVIPKIPRLGKLFEPPRVGLSEIMKKPSYVCEDGMFLALNERSDGYYVIGWWDPNSDCFGAFLGEGLASFETPRDRDEWEFWIADKAVAEFAEERVKTIAPFRFKNQKIARLALSAANKALREGNDVPWPAWAIQAQAAGWTPPKGWKP